MKAAKAAKLAQEAIDGPRADNDKSDEELAAEKEAEEESSENCRGNRAVRHWGNG